jgi:hypothetical protein
MGELFHLGVITYLQFWNYFSPHPLAGEGLGMGCDNYIWAMAQMCHWND